MVTEEEQYRAEVADRFAREMKKMVLRKAVKGTWLGYTLVQAFGELAEG